MNTMLTDLKMVLELLGRAKSRNKWVLNETLTAACCAFLFDHGRELLPIVGSAQSQHPWWECAYFVSGPDGDFYTTNKEAALRLLGIVDPEGKDWTLTDLDPSFPYPTHVERTAARKAKINKAREMLRTKRVGQVLAWCVEGGMGKSDIDAVFHGSAHTYTEPEALRRTDDDSSRR